MCNKEVKFGVFLDFALEKGADYIATGHYAQNIFNQATNRYELKRGIDNNKDQSYFLWTLTQKQLAYTLFPVGDTTKDIIRAEAAGAGLLTASKKDSQGVCFLGYVDIPDFLSHYIDLQPGKVYDGDANEIGEHKGAFVYTIGQRQGFTLFSHNTNRQPHFVVSKDIAKNTITVSTSKPILKKTDKLTLKEVRLSNPIPTTGPVQAQTRYRQTPFSVDVTMSSDNKNIFILSNEISEAVAKGQSCVLYSENVCLGGGIIS